MLQLKSEEKANYTGRRVLRMSENRYGSVKDVKYAVTGGLRMQIKWDDGRPTTWVHEKFLSFVS